MTQDTPQIIPALKDAFEGKFLIGTALSWQALQGREPRSVELALKHFDAFTAENSMKPETVHPHEGQFNFTDGDRLVQLAEESGATVVGHTLVWHEQAPPWMFQGRNGAALDRAVGLTRMREHIAAVVGHYKGRVAQWDVVNEALSDAPNEILRSNPWRRAIGEDYIAEAFRAAHAADPEAMLIYNDYNIEREYKRPKALQLLKSLLAEEVPVHAVGIQGHWRMDSPSFSEVEDSIRQFADLGLKIAFTEVDIGVLSNIYNGEEIAKRMAMTPEMHRDMNPYSAGLPADMARRHADRYRQAFEMFLRHRDVIERVSLWGVEDGGSWFNEFPLFGRTDYPLLFDREGKPKPAFFAIREVAETYTPPTPPARRERPTLWRNPFAIFNNAAITPA